MSRGSDAPYARLGPRQARDLQATLERYLPHLQFRCLVLPGGWVLQVHDDTGHLGDDRVLKTDRAVLYFLVEQAQFQGMAR